MRFYMDFGNILAAFFEYVFDFPESTKNAEPHESVINSNEIEGRAAAKISKKS